MKQPPPIDMPDDFGTDDTPRRASIIAPIAITFMAFGLLMGLALGELWSLIGAAS